jgi:hypothetical protein
MNKLTGSVVCLLFVIGGMFCPAQKVPIPFRQIERDAQFNARQNFLENERDVGSANSSYLMAPSVSGTAYMRPVYKEPRTLDAKFFILNGIHLGVAALDSGLTQRCIANHHCREGNPFMPSSFAGQVEMNSAIIGSGFAISYRLKKQQNKAWWISPVAGIAAHTAGVVTGFVNR